MHWKDFFRYQKSERMAIFLLLGLIVLALILNVLLMNKQGLSVDNSRVDSLNEAFDRFRKNLKTKDSTFAENNDWALPRRNSGYRYAREKSVSKSESKGSEIYPAFAKTEKLAEHEKISINTVDTAEWKKVPGIGSAYAARIVKYRNLLGGFYEVEQLREVYGISD